MFKVEFEDNSYKRTTIGTFNTIEEDQKVKYNVLCEHIEYEEGGEPRKEN